MKDEILLVYVTAPDRSCALGLAKLALESKLAACANILEGMTSLYFWQGKIEQAQESVLLLKTAASCWSALEEKLKMAHPYETPCIVAWPLAQAAPAYLQWLYDALKEEKEP